MSQQSKHTIHLDISGMHCRSCELVLEQSLSQVPGVAKVEVSQPRGAAEVHYEPAHQPSQLKLTEAVQAAGYTVGKKEKLPWLSRNAGDYKLLLKAAALLVAVYLVARWMGIFNLSVNPGRTGLLVALVMGLVAGISTCMAIVGGLVLSLSARHADRHPEATPRQKFRPHLFFNLGRIGGYAAFGGLIGLLGASFQLSSNALGILTIFVGFVMIFFGLKLIEIFPALRNKNITLPASLAKLLGLHRETKEYSHRGAVMMGALTFFLPCGFTQAMQLYAVSTGSFWQGSAIMMLFAIGTAPGLLGIGGLTSVVKGRRARLMFASAGLLVIILGGTNITNGKNLLSGTSSAGSAGIAGSAAIQEVRMVQGAGGYSPNSFTVEVNRPVRWIINSTSPYSCASSLVVPSLKVQRGLKAGENIIEFTPTRVGQIPFSCSMGMYRGAFNVVAAGSRQLAAAPPAVSPGSTCGGGGSGGGGCGGGGSGGGGCGGGSAAAREQVQAPPPATQNGEQLLTATYTRGRDLQPNVFTVKRGAPVRLTIDVQDDGRGCMSTIMIRDLYQNPQLLRKGSAMVLTFTPQREGDYPITCAMGVPRGVIRVTS